VIAAFGALNGWILLASQIPLAASRDGLFPQAFSRVSERGVPTVGLVVSGVLASLLLVFNYTRGLVEMFTFIILLATLNTLIPYALCSLAYFVMPRRPDEPASPDRTVGHALIAVAAFLYSAWAILGAGKDAVYWGSLLLLAGIPVFVWLKRPSAQRSSP
jgi:APA family basic amino acid/polyamine antiporter